MRLNLNYKMLLTQLESGSRANIHSILPGDTDRQYLYELGLLPGEEIELIRRAPWGGPIIIRIMGCELCLRRKCASFIRVNKIRGG